MQGDELFTQYEGGYTIGDVRMDIFRDISSHQKLMPISVTQRNNEHVASS